MRKILILASVVSINFTFGQFSKDDSDNTFTQSEKQSVPEHGGEMEASEPGGPGDPIPINQHLPLLALTGIILILGTKFHRKSISN